MWREREREKKRKRQLIYIHIHYTSWSRSMKLVCSILYMRALLILQTQKVQTQTFSILYVWNCPMKRLIFCHVRSWCRKLKWMCSAGSPRGTAALWGFVNGVPSISLCQNGIKHSGNTWLRQKGVGVKVDCNNKWNIWSERQEGKSKFIIVRVLIQNYINWISWRVVFTIENCFWN